MPEPTPKIFISYAWKNQPIAKRLQSDLKRDGVEVFVDYERITGGESLPVRISAGLKWCNTLLLLWSADAAQSYYVEQEWTSAFHLQKRIIPCVLDDAPLPEVLASRLYLNFAPYETGYAQLCRSLGVEPKVIAKPVAPPVPPQSKLPLQHAEMPAPLLPTEKRETPPVPPKRKSLTDTFRRKPKPPDPAPVLKPPEVFDDTKNDAASANPSVTAARGFWWKTTGAIIVLAIAIFLTQQMICREPSRPTSEQEQAQKATPTKTKQLFRDKPATLSAAQVKAMLRDNDFYCRDYEWTKEFSNPQGRGFANQFEKSPDGKVIFDRASGLTWQQSGSDKSMTFAEAEKYVADLNAQNFAGHKDWRLPTLEEAMSLMEPTVPDGDLYIDFRFDRKQRWIWTADKVDDAAGVAWSVYFGLGYCSTYDVSSSTFHVRAVRSGQS